MTATLTERYLRAARLSDLQEAGSLVTRAGGYNIVLFYHEAEVYAVDNRCPHMGFPLDRGSVKDCILTCHWHHARFDLKSGGTFDQWADDVRAFPVEVRGDEIWIDLAPRVDPRQQDRERLRDGLERSISLVIAKAVIRMLDGEEDPAVPFRIGLEFGTRNRRGGWGQGLTIHACMMNLLPSLDPEDRPRALFHGLSAVAQNSAGEPARFLVRPLPDTGAPFATLKRWFRRFVEVRDSEGAERCISSAVREGADHRQIADMLFAAATDHRYIATGHPLDFTNKALEALDIAGWEHAESALTSLVSGYAGADRMEESNAWRNPVDLIAILDGVFEQLPAAVEQGSERTPGGGDGVPSLAGRLVPTLLGEDPQAVVDVLLEAVRAGTPMADVAGVVAYAAALRIARFHTSNEFGDWDRALHTFTFANAVHQGLRRFASPDLLRGIFDAAMSVYLDRFLNVPAVRLPEPNGARIDPDALLEEIPALLDHQQQVNEAGGLVARYLAGGGDPDRLLAALGRALLREDRDFHTIQSIEAAFRQYGLLRDTPLGPHVLVAAARYLAAHAPTVRSQGQTYRIAQRLHRGEALFEEA